MKATIFSNKNHPRCIGLLTLCELETFSIATIIRDIDGQIITSSNQQHQIDIIILEGISRRKLLAEIDLAVEVRVGVVLEPIAGQIEVIAPNHRKDLCQGSARGKVSTKETMLSLNNDSATDILNRPKKMRIGKTLTCNRRRSEEIQRIQSMLRGLRADVAPSDKREAC